MMPFSILVVESDSLTRETLGDMLRALKYDAFEVEGTELALGALQAVFVNVVLCSLPFHEQDGEGFAVKAKLIQNHLKVIVASGDKPPQNLPQSIDAFIQKPFSLNAINEVITIISSKILRPTYG